MSRFMRHWKLLLPLGVLVITRLGRRLDVASRRRSANEVRVAIMTDCKGAFGFGYEPDIGGAQAAFAQYAGGKVEEPEEAVRDGMTGIKVGGTTRRDRRLRLRRRHGRRPPSRRRAG